MASTPTGGDRSSASSQTTADVDLNEDPLFLDSDTAIVDAAEKVAVNCGVPMAQVALAWVLRNTIVAVKLLSYPPVVQDAP